MKELGGEIWDALDEQLIKILSQKIISSSDFFFLLLFFLLFFLQKNENIDCFPPWSLWASIKKTL